jgi:hypothetical protein
MAIIAVNFQIGILPDRDQLLQGAAVVSHARCVDMSPATLDGLNQ